ncbi:MAG: hypothetical protein WB930_01705 [Syntrophobacteraceae bacterium]
MIEAGKAYLGKVPVGVFAPPVSSPNPLEKQENKAADHFRTFPGVFAKAIMQIITLAKFLEKYSFAH